MPSKCPEPALEMFEEDLPPRSASAHACRHVRELEHPTAKIILVCGHFPDELHKQLGLRKIQRHGGSRDVAGLAVRPWHVEKISKQSREFGLLQLAHELTQLHARPPRSPQQLQLVER